MKKIPPFYERHPLLIILASYLVIILSAYYSRRFWFESLIPGADSYFNMELSRQVLTHGLEQTESLLGFARPFFITPFHIIIANLIYFIDPFRVAQILPMLAGVLTLIFLWIFLANLRIAYRLRFFMLLMILLSPVFIKSSIILSPITIYVLLISLALNFLLSDNEFSLFLGFLLLWIVSLGGLAEVIVSCLILIGFFNIRRRGRFLFAAFASVFIFTVRTSFFINDFGYPNISHTPILNNLLTILGANWGFGLFGLLLGIGGVILSWKKKSRLWPIFLMIACLVVLFFIGMSPAYLVLLLSAFAGYTIEHFIERQWALSFIKDATVWLIICGVLFSSFMQISLIVRSEPHPDTMNGLSHLSDICAPKDVVLSHSSRGYWIESVAGCVPVADDNLDFVKDGAIRLRDMNIMFNSKDLNRVRRLLKRYEVRYIVIDRAMKEGLVWDNPDDGLLFLFRNNETFKNLINYPSIQIWEVT